MPYEHEDIDSATDKSCASFLGVEIWRNGCRIDVDVSGEGLDGGYPYDTGGIVTDSWTLVSHSNPEPEVHDTSQHPVWNRKAQDNQWHDELNKAGQ